MDLIGIQVSHSQWGIGTIIAHEGICLTVAFPDTTKRFIYPNAIGTHIQATDPSIHSANFSRLIGQSSAQYGPLV